MKQGRKLTRDEKVLVRNNRLNPDEWQFLDECRDSTGRPTSYFKVINKQTNKIKILDRFSGKRKGAT